MKKKRHLLLMAIFLFSCEETSDLGINEDDANDNIGTPAIIEGTLSTEINESNVCKPVNYYGLSKLACENIINNEFGFCNNVCFSSVYGFNNFK